MRLRFGNSSLLSPFQALLAISACRAYDLSRTAASSASNVRSPFASDDNRDISGRTSNALPARPSSTRPIRSDHERGPPACRKSSGTTCSADARPPGPISHQSSSCVDACRALDVLQYLEAHRLTRPRIESNARPKNSGPATRRMISVI